MSILVVPIRPVFAYRIFLGIKRYDLRKVNAWSPEVKPEDRAVLYVTGNVKAFMGEYIVGEVITGTPEQVIRELKKKPNTGVREEDFTYIQGASYALAMEVINPILYKYPVEMKEVLKLIPDYHPPLGLQKLSEYEPLVTLVFNKARDYTLKSIKKTK